VNTLVLHEVEENKAVVGKEAVDVVGAEVGKKVGTEVQNNENAIHNVDYIYLWN
jgi:hypothetical protein